MIVSLLVLSTSQSRIQITFEPFDFFLVFLIEESSVTSDVSMMKKTFLLSTCWTKMLSVTLLSLAHFFKTAFSEKLTLKRIFC